MFEANTKENRTENYILLQIQKAIAFVTKFQNSITKHYWFSIEEIVKKKVIDFKGRGTFYLKSFVKAKT